MTVKSRQRPGGHQHFLLASDFDKTLSFNDSGIVLAELLGVPNFEAKVDALSRLNMVQQGGELAYMLVHDPDLRAVRREHLLETGKKIKLKYNIQALIRALADGLDDCRFSFYVISAAPEEVIQSALKGVVPPENIFASRFNYDERTGEIRSLVQVPAGYGKVAALSQLQSQLRITDNRVIYSGDGSSDVHVMLHVNQRKGYTIAVSEAPYVTQITRRTVLSDDALAVLVPVFEDILGWDTARIRSFFESQGLIIQEWSKMRTDRLTIRAAL